MQKGLKKIKRVAEYLEKTPLLTGCLLFVVSCVFLTWLQWSPTFADPDSFYHIKIAERMRDQRDFVTKFPWLPHTVLAENFADQAWLYHIFLIPFTYFPDPLIGLKIATGLLDVTLIVCIYWIMRKWNIRYAWVYIIILLLTNPFIFRISLAKTPAISVFMFLIGLYALLDCHPPTCVGGYRNKNKKNIFLFFIALIFTWTHAAWPLLIVASCIHWVVAGIFHFKQHLQANSYQLKAFQHLIALTRALLKTHERKLVLATMSGSLLGLVINPYFPQNLSFFWYQTILISLKSYKHIIGVGSEWYGFPLAELIGSSAFVFSAALIATVTFFTRLRYQTKNTWTLLLTSIALLFLTLSARRNSEYFIPVAVLFSALIFSQTPQAWWRSFCFLPLVRGGLRGGVGFQNVYGDMKYYPLTGNTPSHTSPLLGGGVWLAPILFFALAIPFIIVRDTVRIKHLLTGRYAFTKYAPAAEWITDNIPAGSVLFHTGWEDFPILFYRAPQFRYLIGLDPVFLYLASPEKYQLWFDLKHGKVIPDSTRIAAALGTTTLVVEKTHANLQQKLVTRPDWMLAYEDTEVWIYQKK